MSNICSTLLIYRRTVYYKKKGVSCQFPKKTKIHRSSLNGWGNYRVYRQFFKRFQADLCDILRFPAGRSHGTCHGGLLCLIRGSCHEGILPQGLPAPGLRILPQWLTAPDLRILPQSLSAPDLQILPQGLPAPPLPHKPAQYDPVLPQRPVQPDPSLP